MLSVSRNRKHPGVQVEVFRDKDKLANNLLKRGYFIVRETENKLVQRHPSSSVADPNPHSDPSIIKQK